MIPNRRDRAHPGDGGGYIQMDSPSLAWRLQRLSTSQQSTLGCLGLGCCLGMLLTIISFTVGVSNAGPAVLTPTPNPHDHPLFYPTPAVTPTVAAPTPLTPTVSTPTMIPPTHAVNPQDFKMSFLALGDWGVTDDSQHTSTTHGKHDDKYDRAFYAQRNIAEHMNAFAKASKPSFVLGHGDSFYWTGVSSADDRRFSTMFEDLYTAPELMVPWYNVMGNHDYGGGSGFCGGSCWNCGEICPSVPSMLEALNRKFEAQRDYRSPNNRWFLTDHYYTAMHSYPAESATPEFSVEIFNIETNAAGNRVVQICCQCFNTPASPNCDNPRQPGRDDCVSDDQFNACKSRLDGWWQDSMNQLERDLVASTATWKIVHNHYLMKFFTPEQQAQLGAIMKKGGAHVFIGGHEHSEGHDYIDGVHHLQNGGGGGAIAQGGTGSIWYSGTYGFVAAKVSAYYMQVLFYDDAGAKIHCYNIPLDGSDRDNHQPFIC